MPSDSRRSARGSRLHGPLGQALLIVEKDLLVEWRSREIVYTTVFFAVLVVLIFSFALSQDGLPIPEVAGGLLWVVVPFAGTLGLNRVFQREIEGDTRRALLLSPLAPSTLYLAKLAGVLILIFIIELFTMPLLIILFKLEVQSWPLLLVLLLGGTLGFSAVGCLFAATLMTSRGRDVLLPLLTYPIVIPVIVAGAKGTAALLAGPEQAEGALVWLKVLLAFDVTFVTLSLWAFGPLTRME